MKLSKYVLVLVMLIGYSVKQANGEIRVKTIKQIYHSDVIEPKTINHLMAGIFAGSTMGLAAAYLDEKIGLFPFSWMITISMREELVRAICEDMKSKPNNKVAQLSAQIVDWLVYAYALHALRN